MLSLKSRILLSKKLVGKNKRIKIQNLDERLKTSKTIELIKFSKSLEEVCINTVESGSMTKDLAILIDKSTKYLTTNQFLEIIDYNLKKKLN